MDEINEKNEVDEIEKLKKEVGTETHFNMKILALKSKKVMLITEKDGN